MTHKTKVLFASLIMWGVMLSMLGSSIVKHIQKQQASKWQNVARIEKQNVIEYYYKKADSVRVVIQAHGVTIRDAKYLTDGKAVSK